MDRTDIQRIMDRVPGLNALGIGVYDEHKKPLDAREDELAHERAKLLDSADSCTRVCEWLSQIKRARVINDRRDSGCLKHIAEGDLGYVSNGVFITAAIHSGFRFRVEAGNPKVPFGMSERSIRSVMQRQKAEGKKNWVL